MRKMLLLVFGGGALLAGIGLAQVPSGSARPLPHPVAIAETRLLMEGLLQPNYQGLEKLLQQKPPDAEAWGFARGQALLIAETGNLLMLRPPRSEGREIWLERAADLRATATRLARAAGTRDYEQSRTTLKSLAYMCNRCHESFRVSVRIATPALPSRPPAP